MSSWIFAPHNLPFAIALCCVAGYALLELIGLLIGFSLADALDGDGIDADGGGFMAWLCGGPLPFVIAASICLAAFAAAGFTTLATYAGGPLSPWLAGPLAAGVAIPAARSINRLAGKWMPKEETSAVGRAELLGLTGVVTLGSATEERAAEIKLRGPKGDTHYVMAFAIGPDLPQGSAVLLVSLHETQLGHYRAVRDTASEELARA
jgi:Protein of unknown function (DUF1449)